MKNEINKLNYWFFLYCIIIILQSSFLISKVFCCIGVGLSIVFCKFQQIINKIDLQTFGSLDSFLVLVCTINK
jgi:hypothetical protein